MAGAINPDAEAGTWTRRVHRYNGHSSGSRPSRSQWREWERTTSATRPGIENSIGTLR